MRTLCAGFDPGIVNAAVAFFDPHRRRVLVRTYDMTGGRGKRALPRKSLCRSVKKIVDDCDALFRRTAKVAIEIQMKADMIAVAQVFEAIVRERHPEIDVRAVAASTVRARFGTRSTESYADRKRRSLMCAESLFGENEIKRVRTELGIAKNAADPFEATLFAIQAAETTTDAKNDETPALRSLTTIMRLPTHNVDDDDDVREPVPSVGTRATQRRDARRSRRGARDDSAARPTRRAARGGSDD
jgi:hypothetical protein